MASAKSSLNGLSILIPDGESYIILGVLRCLSMIEGIQLFVISETRNTAVRRSRYITEFIHCAPISRSDEWIEMINQISDSRNIDVILPVFEISSRKLIRHREMLRKPHSLLLPTTQEKFNTAENKWHLALHLAQNGIPGPISLSAEKYFGGADMPARIPFPLLVKRVIDTGGGEGITRFDCPEDLRQFFTDRLPDASMVIQEYVEGYDLGCNVLCKNGEVLAYTIQQGTVFSPKPFTPQVGLKMIHDERVIGQVKHLMHSLDWSGVANIDMRYDIRNDRFLILEINARFWYTVLASALAGVNFPELYCKTVLGRSFPIPAYQEIEYLNDKGLIQSIVKTPGILWTPGRIIKNTPLCFQIRDWRMTLSHLFWSLKNRIFGRDPIASSESRS